MNHQQTTTITTIHHHHHHGDNVQNGNHHQFHPTAIASSNSCAGSLLPILLSNNNNNGSDCCNQQQLSTSTTMIHSSSPPPSSSSLLIKPQQGGQLSSVSTCQSADMNYDHNVNQQPSSLHCCTNVNQSPPIITTSNSHQLSLMITTTSPSPSSNCFGTNNLSTFSLGGGNSRDRAISSPPPLSHMKKHIINPVTNNPSPSSNSSHSSVSSGLISPNCSDQMNLDDDCVMDQTYEERPRRFSLPSNDLISMPFFRKKPQNLTNFQLFNPDTPIKEPEIELKDITGMTVLSHSDCKEQYEMLVEELKEFNLYFSCDNI